MYAESWPKVLRISLNGASILITSENQRRFRSKIGRGASPSAVLTAVGSVGTPTYTMNESIGPCAAVPR